MSDVIHWCEIAETGSGHDDERARARYLKLDQALQAAGLKTELQFLTATSESLPAVLESAKSSHNQIRFSGLMSTAVIPLLERLPSAILSLKACDALVCDNHDWWPRFFLVDGLNQTLASDASTLDLTGSVFILGANANARASVAALSKIGFNKIIVSDPDPRAGAAFVQDLSRAYFGIQFQSVARESVTQLPGVCSIAVNTLNEDEDRNSANELAYFNFLKPGGFWLDLALFPLNTALQTEAISVGAKIVSGARVFATADRLWAESAFKVLIDRDPYALSLGL